MEHFEIVSLDGDSDSDWDLDEIKAMYDQIPSDDIASVNHRATPSTVDNARPNLTVDGESYQEPPTGASTFNGISAKPSPTSLRVLPSSWGNTTSAGLIDNNKPSRKSPFRAAGRNGSSSNHSHQTQAGHHRTPGPTSNSGFSNLKITQDTDPTSSAHKDNDQHISQQGYKRALPASIQPQVPNPRSINLVENVGSSQTRETFGKSFTSQPKSTPGMDHMKYQTGWGSDDKLITHPSSVSRILSLSLMHAKSTSTSQHANSVDPVFRSTTGEERVVEYDERLIFQAALQDLNQPKIEVDLPNGLMTVSLLRHQKIALNWMLQKETKSTHCAGGILADDQGLGKTISMAALILM